MSQPKINAEQLDVGSGAGQIATTDFVGTEITNAVDDYSTGELISANGYQLFSNGFAVYWGTVTYAAYTGSTIVLPFAYTSSAYGLSTSTHETGAWTSHAHAKAQRVSTSSIYIENMGGLEIQVNWMTTGFRF